MKVGGRRSIWPLALGPHSLDDFIWATMQLKTITSPKGSSEFGLGGLGLLPDRSRICFGPRTWNPYFNQYGLSFKEGSRSHRVSWMRENIKLGYAA